MVLAYVRTVTMHWGSRRTVKVTRHSTADAKVDMQTVASDSGLW